MSIPRAFLKASFLATILGSALSSSGEDSQFRRVWSAPEVSVWERAEAVNRVFTNGTPIATIVAKLGTNYGVLRPFSSVWIGPGPEPRKTCSLLYDFGPDTVTIGTSADIGGDPLRGRFTGAGSCSSAAPSTGTSNKSPIGQPIGTPSQSQLGRSETNRPTAAPRIDRLPLR